MEIGYETCEKMGNVPEWLQWGSAGLLVAAWVTVALLVKFRNLII